MTEAGGEPRWSEPMYGPLLWSLPLYLITEPRDPLCCMTSSPKEPHMCPWEKLVPRRSEALTPHAHCLGAPSGSPECNSEVEVEGTDVTHFVRMVCKPPFCA